MLSYFALAAVLATSVSALPAGAKGDAADRAHHAAYQLYSANTDAGGPQWCVGMGEWKNGEVPRAVLRKCGNNVDTWSFSAGGPGSTHVYHRHNRRKMCLDAAAFEGAFPGADVRVRSCDDNAAGQQWEWTHDGRLALRDQGLCLDVRGGNYHDGAALSVWNCIDGNENQHFQYTTKAG